VAAVLLVGLVAVPFLLGGGGEPVAATSFTQPTTAADGEGAQLLKLASGTSPGDRRGVLAGSDPFRRVPGGSPTTTSAGATASGGGFGAGPGASSGPSASAADLFGGGGGGGGSSSGGSSPAGGFDSAFGDVPGLDDIDVIPIGGDTGGGSDTGAPAKEPAKGPSSGSGSSPAGNDSYHVDLRFGPAGGVAPRNDVARLTPLPSAQDPFFVFLGVLADGKTALFLVSSDAEATGDGTCKPSPQSCERIEMRAGDTEFFDLTTPEGEVVQYQLDLRSVHRRRAAKASVATAARTRESEPGRTILRAAVDRDQVDVSDLAYSRELGLLVPTGGEAQEGPGGVFGGYRTDLRFGPADAGDEALVKRYNLARLTPLPSTDDPSFVFLGVVDGGRDALFLNPTGAKVSGDGVCLPDPDSCQRVQVAAGAETTLDVPTMDGRTAAYTLAVDGISERTVDTPEEAAAAKRRESPAGRVILRRLIHEIGDLVGDLAFSAEEGTIVQEEAPAGE
jgi:hypothetical protein